MFSINPFDVFSKSFSQGLFHTCGSRFKTIFAALLVGLLFPPGYGLATAEGDEFRAVRLAGTFNNWNVSDDSLALKRHKDRLRLVRFWECGVYDFKFVFDGSWARHLGSAGGDRLTQPGENIRLTVPQSATYSIGLDVEKKRWGLDRIRPVRPVAHFRVVGAETGAVPVILDARLSQAPEGRRIDSYHWEITSPGGVDAVEPGSSNKIEPAMYRLDIRRPCRLEIKLTVKSGKQTAEMRKNVRLGHGWITWNEMRKSRPDVTFNMLPLDGAAWGATYSGGDEIHVSPPISGGTSIDKDVPYSISDSGAFLARFDPAARALTFHREGFRELIFNADSKALPDDAIVERVDIVGDFNGWTPGRTPMYEIYGKRTQFRRILELPEGVYRYKFIVNGSKWMEDPKADSSLRIPDDTGGHSSGFRIGPNAAKLGAAKPNDILCDAVRHDPASGVYFQPIGDDLVRVGVRTLAGDVQSVVLDRSRSDAPVALNRDGSRFGFDFWSANLSTEKPQFSYTLSLIDGKARSLLDSLGCHEMPAEPGVKISLAVQPFEADLRMNFETPDWAKRAVWYQIFPERFRNGDEANDPPRTVPWRHAWDKPYDGSHTKDASRRFKETGKFFEHIYERRYGGDIQGIKEQLPYLRDLGINALYLNPIFLAESLHKYDASDYRHIDDFFGVAGSLKKVKGETTDPATWKWSESDKVFLEFLNEAHAQGFKVILDGVFNHVGRDFWAFQDLLKHGKKSKFADWFDITSWEPFHYRAWDKDDGSLPRLKHDDALGLCEPVREHLFAVTRRWMDPNGDGDPSDGIDGWRLDVAGDINANFWRDWRKVVKTVNPDAYIVAELWEESKAWLDGQTFDAVMNYPFARSAQRYFVNDKKCISPTEFDRQLREVLGWYAPQVSYVLQNLFDSHDTDRAASMFMNPDLEYDQANRLQDNGPNYDSRRPNKECYEKLKLMVTHQMTYLGAPMVYYGDEVGMYGADDPSCRKPMLWADLLPYDDAEERIEKGVFDHYRRMIAIRNTYPALQLGSLNMLLTDDAKGVYAFARSLDGQSVVVVINNSGQQHRLDVPSPWADGSMIVRLDDPKEAEIVDPASDDPAGRPLIKAKNLHQPHVRVEGGHLRGMMLHPYGAAVLTKIGT